jgi:ComF family protein
MYYNIRKDCRLPPFLKKLLEGVFDFLLPRTKRAEEIAAMNVEELLKRARSSSKPPVADTRALFSYSDPLVKDAIWLLKYRRNKDAARLFGETLGNIAAEWLEDLRMFENFVQPILVPIPMGKNRLRERGGNHCEFLCEEMMKTMPAGAAEYEPRALYKIRETPSQARTKSRAERLKNLSGSFAANSRLVRGRNILLIDDVITTGATIEEARKTLLQAGARKVTTLAIAH